MTDNDVRLRAALARFDAINAADPHAESVDGRSSPKELVYAERMTAWLDRLRPNAPAPLRLAVRGQHLQRWAIPRSDYPQTRAGYKQWRTALAKYHAALAGEVLREVGYDEAIIERVQSLLRKENLKRDEDAQTLEDVACLVFLQHYFADFATRHDDDKLVDIVRKTWRKMSPQGRAAAARLELPPRLAALVQRALQDA
jgi:hypothetical protein